jgi:hypothetical protein
MKQFSIYGLMCLALCALTAFAQSGGPFTLDWSTIDGGGGASTGGPFAFSGTIGQQDASGMSGGRYSLAGGFWGAYAVQASGAPSLGIEHLAGGAVRVFWPLPATGFVLDQVSALNGSPVAGWVQVSPSVYQTNATHVSITVPAPVGNRFYQLRR